MAALSIISVNNGRTRARRHCKFLDPSSFVWGFCGSGDHLPTDKSASEVAVHCVQFYDPALRERVCSRNTGSLWGVSACLLML